MASRIDGGFSTHPTSLWNMTDTSINIDSISIQSFHIGTNPVMSTGEGYYSVNPPIIAEKGYKCAGTASPQCRSTISLLQSSPNNPNNIFSRNHHIDVGARFSAYDFNYTFLSVELVSFDW